MENSMIDWKATIAKADGDKIFAENLVHDFIKALPDDKVKITVAFEQHDIEVLRRNVHKLKGGLSFCIVPALNIAVRALEQACINLDEEKIKIYYAEVMKLMDDLLREAIAPEKP